MTKDKVKEVLAIYRKKMEEMDISKKKLAKKKFSSRLSSKSDNDCLMHCHVMLDEMEYFIEEGRIEKVFRWLGFIQGCFWKCGVYTLDQMQNHNRP